MPERRDIAGDGRGTATLAEAPAADPIETPRQRTYTLRVPPISPTAPFLGWLTAWGAAAVAMACLREAGVDLGLGLGIATGEPGVEDRFFPGLWVLLVQAGRLPPRRLRRRAHRAQERRSCTRASPGASRCSRRAPTPS